MYIRKQIFQGLGQESAFLWGARQTGKSTLLKALFPETLSFDLLLGDIFERFHRDSTRLPMPGNFCQHISGITLMMKLLLRPE